jgi:hypothetical protein
VTAAGRPGAARERPLIGVALIVVAIVVIAIAVDRLPGGARPSAAHGGQSTQHNLGPIGVVVELPAAPTRPGSSTTTSTPTSSSSSSGGSSSTTSSTSSTTTTTPIASSGIVAELRARGYIIEAVVNNTNPPPRTKIQFLHKLGSIRAAVAIAGLLGLGRSVVSAYPGPPSGLPAGTNVVVILGKSA